MSKARHSSLAQRARSVGGWLVRRAGLLPGGVPDGLGQDAALVKSRLPHTVMVYFADTVGSLYQIEQWYEPFRLLDRRHRVVVVTKDSRAAKDIRAHSRLDTVVIAHDTTMSELLSRSEVKVALYVNHNPENFSNLRFNSVVHASLMHGDSDKGVTVSNQTKAYDFSLVAGQAAVDRMAAFSTFYDANERCIPIGRPQVADQEARRLKVNESPKTADLQRTVLYAPTWEGPQPSAAYGSIESHGGALVESLLRAGWRVIFRPHPLSGVRSADYGEADARIRQVLRDHEATDPRGHRTDTTGDPAQAFADADIMICDISGIAMDWLPSGRPLILTVPAGREVSIARSPLTDLVPRLPFEEATRADSLAHHHLESDPLAAQRRDLTAYYLGDLRPGASLKKFLEAVERMIELRDAGMSGPGAAHSTAPG